MSVGSVGKWLSIGLFVAAVGVGVGCGEDDPEDKDSGTDGGGMTGGGTTGGGTTGGGTTGGGTTGGGGDAGSDAGPSCPDNPGTNNACCGADKKELCTKHTTALGDVKAGCALNEMDAEVCGISSMNVLGGMEPLFMEKNAPGVLSESCGKFYDSLESVPDGGVDAGLKGNGLIDTQRNLMGLMIALQYPGCCTAAGFCSISGKDGKASTGAGYNPSDNGYGCMKSTIAFRGNPEFGPAGTPVAGFPLRAMPCDPTTGVMKTPAPAGDAGASDAGDAGASDASNDAAG